MKYFFIAGERSGDLHGGNLIRAIRKHDERFEGKGFGGDQMKDAGMDVLVHYDQLAFMGFTAVVANLGTIRKLMKQCKEELLSYKPDVLVLIDYGGFNMRMAKFAKENGIRVYYYISPKVWAWNTSRAWKLKATVDRMFCILPFEEKFYQQFDWKVDYVGNPVLDAIKNFRADSDFMSKNDLPKDKPIIALLPGSRKIELKRMLPVMAAVATKNPQYQFAVAAVRTLPDSLYNPVLNVPNIRLVYDVTYDLLSNASAALVTSGTATLETALFKVPQGILYKAGVIEEKVVRALIKVRYISLVNLIADADVVKEFIQYDMTEENLSKEIDLILNNSDYRKKMLSEYDRIYKILDTGSASENAGRLIVQYLKAEMS